MGWHSVIITKPARLFLSKGCLVVEQEEKVSIPLEDISVIVVETHQATITSALLDKLAELAVPLFSCDVKHIPSGVHLPFQKHSRFLKVLKAQLNQTEPFKKNCWKLIVGQKIKNQAECLRLLGKTGAEDLLCLADSVKSGDPTNREGTAAQLYFSSYMPFSKRKNDDTVNAALNYGYSIIRGAVARSLTSYGFLCAVGIHHKNELNSFNLADDFMEMLRPVVDLWVAQNIENNFEFSTEQKIGLLSLLNKFVYINSEKQTVNRAIDIMIASYSTAVSKADYKLLKLPEIISLNE